MKIAVTEDQAAKCFAYFEALIGPLRETARQHGYALGVHGSCRRDIDLIAAPWATEAADPLVLAEAIRKTAETVAGCCFVNPHESGPYFLAGCPGMKSHGRLCFTYFLIGSGSPYIDLSIMPRMREMTGEEIVAATDACREKVNKCEF